MVENQIIVIIIIIIIISQKDYYRHKSFCLPNPLLNCESNDPYWLRQYRSTMSFSTKPCLSLPLPSQVYNTGCSKMKCMALIFKLWCLNLTQFYLHPFFQWLPESCRYYLAAGEKEKAARVLQRVAKNNKTEMPVGTLEDAIEVFSRRIYPSPVPFTFRYWVKFNVQMNQESSKHVQYSCKMRDEVPFCSLLNLGNSRKSCGY